MGAAAADEVGFSAIVPAAIAYRSGSGRTQPDVQA
jgi:hypothetical protein